MFIIWSLHLLVPINLSRNYKLTPGPAVLFNNSAKLHLRSLAGERFADVKEIDPILKCWRNLLKLNPQGFLKYLMRMKNSLGIERPKFGQFQLFPRVTSSSLISQSSLLNAFKLPSPMLETCQHNTCHRNIKRRERLTLSPDFPRCLCLSPGMTPLTSMLQSGWMVGLLPVRISMSSMASMEAMGALPLDRKDHIVDS